MVSMTREDVHKQIKEMLLILSPNSKLVSGKEGETFHFADDIDLLRACIKHELLDKEACVREAFASGYAKGVQEG